MTSWLGVIPATTQRFDELDSCDHLLFAKAYCRLLVAQQSGLSGDHVEVRVDSGSVASRGFAKASSRGLDRGILLLNDLRKDAQGREIVLHLLEGGERCLAVSGDRCIVIRERRLGCGAATSRIE